MQMGAIAARQVDEYSNRKDYILIDLRSQADYNKFHINGAINIPAERIWDNSNMFQKDKTYVLYCERGGKSTAIARKLAQNGYKAISVIGGIEAYMGKRLN